MCNDKIDKLDLKYIINDLSKILYTGPTFFKILMHKFFHYLVIIYSTIMKTAAKYLMNIMRIR